LAAAFRAGPEALGGSDELHQSRTRGGFEQLRRALHALSGGAKKSISVRRFRARGQAAIYYSLVESCKANNVSPLTYLTYILGNARNKSIALPTPDEFADSNSAHVS
jgi:hypothetical protein